MIRIVSFDIGKKNFAFYLEDVSKEKIYNSHLTYGRLPTIYQRRIKGKMNSYIEEILKEVFLSGTRVEFGVFDIRNDKSSDNLDIQTRVNMLDLLEKYRELWDTCDIILIEQQYFNINTNGKRGKASSANVDAIKLGEICLSYFLERYYPFKEIEFFNSTFKTQTLGAPDKLTKPQRKKWSIEKCNEILTLRDDKDGIELLKDKKKTQKQKLDDISDCLIMTQAYKFKKFIIN
jgi:hypothetical protein